ncbi:MAG: hypothetical protein OXF74_11500 [Rhodobacteraceae bacterium]|nr:hypothetical protein [Paracoccaceae bacterium]
MSVDCLLKRCVAIDLEVNPSRRQIFSFAAIRKTTGSLKRTGDNCSDALPELDDYAASVEFVLGHNVIKHDLCYLRKARANLSILTKPPIDTLWLNPLAFPRNPYHKLVKHDKDARLQDGSASDPEHDARLVFEVLRKQHSKFKTLARDNPDLLAAYHWLTTMAGNSLDFRHFPRVSVLCFHSPPGFVWSAPEIADVVP